MLRRALPEHPDEKKRRFMAAGISAYLAAVIIEEKEMADFVEDMIEKGADPVSAANWAANEIRGRANRGDFTVSVGPIGPSKVGWSIPIMGPTGPSANAEIVKMVGSGAISSASGKTVLNILWGRAVQDGPKNDPNEVHAIAEKMKQVSDPEEIERMVDEIIAANPDKVRQAKAKPALTGWFVGQVIKASGGKANPKVVNDLLKRKLGI
jgi:aspartyl-tRNA(Asn)/glutamyl-tRNA(Gln) amidotransferase subunit B